MLSDWYRKVIRATCRAYKKLYEEATHVKTDSITHLMDAASQGTQMWRLGVAAAFDDTEVIIEEEEEALMSSSSGKELMTLMHTIYFDDLLKTPSGAHGRRLLLELEAVLKQVVGNEVALDLCKLDAVPFDEPAQVVIMRQKLFLKKGMDELNCYVQSNGIENVQEAMNRFRLTLNRELKVASRSTVLAKAVAPSLSIRPLEKKIRDKFRLRLIERLDDELRIAVDTQLHVAVDLMQDALSKDKDTLLAANWRQKELKVIAWRKTNLNRVEGGRKVSDRLITSMQWVAGIQSAIERFEGDIVLCFSQDALAFYKSDPFFAGNVRYFFENGIKPPCEEQRSEGQLEFSIRSLMPKAVDMLGKRMALARTVEVVIDEIKKQAKENVVPMVTMEIWEQMLSQSQTLCFDAIMSECQNVYITTAMKATLNGLMYAIVKTPQQRSSMSAEDFRRVFNIVAIYGAKEIGDELNTFFIALKKAATK